MVVVSYGSFLGLRFERITVFVGLPQQRVDLDGFGGVCVVNLVLVKYLEQLTVLSSSELL